MSRRLSRRPSPVETSSDAFALAKSLIAHAGTWIRYRNPK